MRDMFKTKILLVDDDEITLNSIYDLLSQIGYDVITAHDGLEGLHKFLTNHFDLVITDIAMPKMNGIT
jgi:two-component system chemotaxis sensor kinase CheA